MVMTHFYQKNVFESCLKISARLRAEILQIRVKTGHFGVKMGITISSSPGRDAQRTAQGAATALRGTRSPSVNIVCVLTATRARPPAPRSPEPS